MEWSITIDEARQYVEIITEGVADESGSLELAKTIPKVMRKFQINRVLIDHRNIRSVSGSVAAVYNRPEQFRELGVIPVIKVAEVVRPEHEEFFEFLELVCVNRGYRFSVFGDKKIALDWLTQK